MAKVDVMYTYVKIDDKVPIHKLSFLETLRAIFLKLGDDNNKSSKTDKIRNEFYNTLRAELVDFLKKVLHRMRADKKKSVLLYLSSDYTPVLNEVINYPMFRKFYKFNIQNPVKMFKGVKFKYIILIEAI